LVVAWLKLEKIVKKTMLLSVKKFIR